MDLADINFSNFAISFSIYSKMWNEFNFNGYSF